MSYTKGALVRCWSYFDQEGRRVNPDTVTAKVKTPGGTTTTYTYPATVDIDNEGVYSVNVSATIAGRWYYRFESTGTGQAAKEGAFDVKAGQFP